MFNQRTWYSVYHGTCILLLLAFFKAEYAETTDPEELTSCQHLQNAETRRAKSLNNAPVRIPRCTKQGEFEPIQCADEKLGVDCWCVDEYGFEIPGTKSATRQDIQCAEPTNCTTSHCRMFCASGFDRDPKSGCSICRCRNPCEDFTCPNGETCHLQEVKCKNEPCPPVPTCKSGRSIENYCAAGLPLSIDDSIRPFLCGTEPGKPECPPLYNCMVDPGNDYGVCCPVLALKIQKPGVCPAEDSSVHTEQTGYICGTSCTHDLECKQMEKCCPTNGCKMNCQQPVNVTNCHQARALSDILMINEREGRGYVPDCSGPGGTFSLKQCSRNGLVCWCVDSHTGIKIRGTMGAAVDVQCEGVENVISRSFGRSFSSNDCDNNICAAVCEYGFKNDHNGCPTCECSEPCEGFKCDEGSHCEVATDPLCESGSALCSSWPVCKPDLVYSNPCKVDTPLQNNITGEILYCTEERQSRALEHLLYYDDELMASETRSMSNQIECPAGYTCTKLHGQSKQVCCPDVEQEAPEVEQIVDSRQQTMCEYLRDFSKRMEGTERGMQLAIPPPTCTDEGNFSERQCSRRKMTVSRAEHRKMLEENAIKDMRTILQSRSKRDIDVAAEEDDGLPDFEMFVGSRTGRLIDSSKEKLPHPQLIEDTAKKNPSVIKKTIDSEALVTIEIEECWCVDNFGTEIPDSRGSNVTMDQCKQLRESIDCLELTCRLGCDFGFDLDPTTKCPSCYCRDPCEGVSCGDDKECRIVDVSCDDENCPPVPACLPRKPGQCPFLVPPGSNGQVDGDFCSYTCRTDSQCEGSKRCCSNGCGTQCVEPQMKTACQHLHAIQLHQSSEMGIPAKQMYVANCDEETGKWSEIQCGPQNVCWCVNSNGEEMSGTRVRNETPVCEINSAFDCPKLHCPPCEFGHKVDENGCTICECRNLCDEITCLPNEACQLINVECIDRPCPKMPICTPFRDSVCPEGNPFKQGNVELSCGPHNDQDVCPTTHTCQLNPVTHRGVCCSKTRDVCFESMDDLCLGSEYSMNNITQYRFSPKANKCLPIMIDADIPCQTKNIFRNEKSCMSVCPLLTPCERLKLKNNLAAQRSRQAIWFEPRCDPHTGYWSPVQCLGNSSDESIPYSKSSNLIADPMNLMKLSIGTVCWCADKKGAPIKGTLTRDSEPTCNNRQARQRNTYSEPNDPFMENLIEQMAMLVTEDSTESNESEDYDTEISYAREAYMNPSASGTDNIFESVNSLLDSKLSIENIQKIPQPNTTRCLEMAKDPSKSIDCDENGQFLPTQCKGKKCWCVDAAGNRLPSSPNFVTGTKSCIFTPIGSVSIELFLTRNSTTSIKDLYDVIKMELHQYIGEPIDNLRVQEHLNNTLVVSFELHDNDNVDKAFLIEDAIQHNRLLLGMGHYSPNLTLCRFIHGSPQSSVEEIRSSQENTIQTAVFILATSSAFLVSLFVIYVMVKRGKQDKRNPERYSINQEFVNHEQKSECNIPVFVLNVDNEKGTKTNIN